MKNAPTARTSKTLPPWARGMPVVYSINQRSGTVTSTIKTAGPSWVTVNDPFYRGLRFHTATGREDTPTGSPGQLYTVEQYQDLMVRQEHLGKIHQALDAWPDTFDKHSTADLERIREVLARFPEDPSSASEPLPDPGRWSVGQEVILTAEGNRYLGEYRVERRGPKTVTVAGQTFDAVTGDIRRQGHRKRIRTPAEYSDQLSRDDAERRLRDRHIYPSHGYGHFRGMSTADLVAAADHIDFNRDTALAEMREQVAQETGDQDTAQEVVDALAAQVTDTDLVPLFWQARGAEPGTVAALLRSHTQPRDQPAPAPAPTERGDTSPPPAGNDSGTSGLIMENSGTFYRRNDDGSLSLKRSAAAGWQTTNAPLPSTAEPVNAAAIEARVEALEARAETAVVSARLAGRTWERNGTQAGQTDENDPLSAGRVLFAGQSDPGKVRRLQRRASARG